MAKKIFDEETGLTIEESLFCEYYIQTQNASEAVRLSGLVDDSGSDRARLVASKVKNRPKVRAYLEKRQKEYFEDVKASSDEVLATLTKIARNQTDELHHGRKTFSAKDRLQALELLGKYHDLFNPKEKEQEQVVINIGIED